MGFFDSLFGGDQADAARAAAADTDAKQRAAIQGITDYGNTFADLFKGMYQPYANTGATANNALAQLLADPSSVRSLPGYQFDLGEGINALDHSAAARGMLNSGRQSKDVMRFGTGLADKTLQSQFQRLMGGAGVGIAGNAGVGTGLTGQLNTRQSAYSGQMQNAPVWGQGQIAGANAEAAGANNILGTALNIGGKIAAFL